MHAVGSLLRVGKHPSFAHNSAQFYIHLFFFVKYSGQWLQLSSDRNLFLSWFYNLNLLSWLTACVFPKVADRSKKVLTLQHYWWSNWCWKKKTQVDDKPHECSWKTRSHYTQSPTVHCSRPPDDRVCRRDWSIHSAQASGHQNLDLLTCIETYSHTMMQTHCCVLKSTQNTTR